MPRVDEGLCSIPHAAKITAEENTAKPNRDPGTTSQKSALEARGGCAAAGRLRQEDGGQLKAIY